MSIRPSIKSFRSKIRETIKKGVALPTDKLIYTLNEKITGWTNYYRNVVSSKVFSSIDDEIFLSLKRWSFKRHSTKSKGWIMKKYYMSYLGRNWRFHCPIKDKSGKSKLLYLKKASDTKIRRHMKIVAKATPFDPLYKEYFVKREEERKKRSLLSRKTELTGLKTIIQPY